MEKMKISQAASSALDERANFTQPCCYKQSMQTWRRKKAGNCRRKLHIPHRPFHPILF